MLGDTETRKTVAFLGGNGGGKNSHRRHVQSVSMCCMRRQRQVAKKELQAALAAEQAQSASLTRPLGRSEALFDRLKASRFRHIFDFLTAVGALS